VVIPDTAPLNHLAAGGALFVLNAMGRVVVPDIVAMEATYFADKPYAGEIAAWLADNLAQTGGPALVVYENGKVPGLLSREGVAAVVAVATTRNFLAMAAAEGIIPDAHRAIPRQVPAETRLQIAEIQAVQRAIPPFRHRLEPDIPAGLGKPHAGLQLIRHGTTKIRHRQQDDVRHLAKFLRDVRRVETR
jgi:predicted aconitase